MKHLFTLLLTFTALILAACGDKEDPKPSTEPSLGVSTNQLTLDSAKDSYADFTLTANTVWEASITTSGAGFHS